jgi:hypothetical protein
MRWTDLWEGRFNMRRREFITLLGGAAAAWPVIGLLNGQLIRTEQESPTGGVLLDHPG